MLSDLHAADVLILKAHEIAHQIELIGRSGSVQDVARAQDTVAFNEGDEVEANFKDRGRWYRGVITGRTKRGFHIRYTDGTNDTEENVKAHRIRIAPRNGRKRNYSVLHQQGDADDEIMVWSAFSEHRDNNNERKSTVRNAG